MLPRVLEPEVMDTAEDASDYDSMDHAAVNAAFCDDLVALRPGLARALDVGTGTARIPIELCARLPRVSVVAIDLADHMLALARRNVERSGLGTRITLERRDAKRTGLPEGSFEAVVSNSIVHHVPEPAAVIAEMWRLASRGGLLFVRDLARPEDVERAEDLVHRFGGAPTTSDPGDVASCDRARGLFRASLLAALTIEEVRALASGLGVPARAVSMTSDRHWTLAFVKP